MHRDGNWEPLLAVNWFHQHHLPFFLTIPLSMPCFHVPCQLVILRRKIQHEWQQKSWLSGHGTVSKDRNGPSVANVTKNDVNSTMCNVCSTLSCNGGNTSNMLKQWLIHCIKYQGRWHLMLCVNKCRCQLLMHYLSGTRSLEERSRIKGLVLYMFSMSLL